MTRRLIAIAGAALALGLVPTVSAHAAPAPAPLSALSSQGSCPASVPLGKVTCFARTLTRNGMQLKPSFAITTQPALTAAPSGGYTPADIAAAYRLPATTSTTTIGIVDAYDDPNAETDLATYRAQFGLPPCTTGNGCFRKRDQNGGTAFPAPDAGWATEISLDLDAASASCPSCKLLLVEASDTYVSSMVTGVNQAVTLGATVLSLSFGGAEAATQTQFDPSFNHPGVAIFAAAGDGDYKPEYPATSPNVIAVGGTTLSRASALPRGWSETVWGPATAAAPTVAQGTGGGCSLYEPKPAWQTDTGCSHRTANDVAADADPATGLAAYDSYGSAAPGWGVFGGTSLAAPLVAGITALAGGAGSTTGAQLFYGPNTSLNDVVTGTNSLTPCVPIYLCNAGAGYDGPTGNGTPNGLPASGAPAPAPPAIVDSSLVAVRGTDGGMYVKRSGQGYVGYGGLLLAAPAVSATSNGNHLYVVLGTDHKLYQRTDTSGFQLAAPDGYCLDSPGLFVSGGSASIACEGADQHLYVNQGTIDAGGVFHATSWQGFGGILASGPSIALVEGQPHYFVEGSDHRVYERTATTGFVTHGWACFGHQAVASYAGQAYFACHGTDGQAWSAVDAGAGWSGAMPLGGALVDGPGLAAYSGGATLYVEGTDQQIYSMLLGTGGAPRAGFTGNGGLCTNGTGASSL
ncbi:MAG: hypothetical protein NVSMB29_08560 [Candidatus Dormibacteria bacterium]